MELMKSRYGVVQVEDGIAVVYLDLEGEKVNTISADMIQFFTPLLERIEHERGIKGMVLISRKKDFIAGADITMFQKEQPPGYFEQLSREGHKALNRLANSSKPVVAAIHGKALGGGLEIALACTARIVSDSKSTALALPEVRLGVIPGGGGTQRLPRLVGIRKALDMMLTGKNIYARKAVRMGLADKVVPQAMLLQAAKYYAKKLADGFEFSRPKRPLFERVLEGSKPGRSLIFKKAREMVQQQTMGNYPAPFAIIDCVEYGMDNGFEKGLAFEAKKWEEMIRTPQSHQLIHLFFAMTAKKNNPMKEKARPVRKIGMLGAGFMGAGIAEVSAVQGIDVVLKDVREEMLIKARQTVWNNLQKKLKQKAITELEAKAIIDRIRGTLEYSDFKNVDIVIEAVFEDLKLKHQVLQETEAVVREDCIFASNTSALPIASIASVSKRPGQIIGMHYFSPVPKMPLLEIITTADTADWVTATCFELGIRQGKTCIVVKDSPGFYTSRILAPYINEALLLLEEGADILDIDRAMKKFGYPVGPVTLLDEVGIDVAAKVTSGEAAKQMMQGREGVKTSTAAVKLYEAGYYGRKNKKGFYKYDASGKKIKGQVDENVYQFFGGNQRKKFPEETIQMRMAMMMVNEAAYCLQEGIIAEPLDGDIGAVFGLGFPPFRGGPFRYMDSLTAARVVEIMDGLAKEYGARFNPAPVIREKAASQDTFYPAIG